MSKSDLRPAVFLDRDGVLTKEKGFVTSVEELEIFGYAPACIKRLHDIGYLAIVITNQSAVARGLLTEEALGAINEYLKLKTGVDDVFYCPHYKDGIVDKYSVECDCRKPGIALIEKARKKYGIDMERSWLAGDRASDIEAGKNAGLRTVLLRSGYEAGYDEEASDPDRIYEDLTEFVATL